MNVPYNTFEHLKDCGLAAFKNGDYKAATPSLMQAADAMVMIAAETTGHAGRATGLRQELAR